MLLEMSLAVRLVILIVLVGLTIWATTRGLQYGILLILPTGMASQWFIRSEGSLPNLSLDRVVWPWVLLVFLWKWQQGKVDKSRPDFIEYSMLTLITVIFLSMTFSGSLSSNKFGDEKLRMGSLLTGFAVPYLSYFLARRGRITTAQAQSLLVGVALITVYLGITGVGEALHQDWLVYPKYILDPNVGIHFGKVRGPFVSASENGLAMAMALPILIWLLVNRRDSSRWLCALGTLLVCICMPYVQQRGPWLGAVLALGVLALTWPKYRAMLTGVLVLALPSAIVFMLSSDRLYQAVEDKFDRSSTIDYRIDMMELTLEQIRQHPLTGVGYNRLIEQIEEEPDSETFDSHNTPLTLFAELGLIGFVPYILIFALLVFESAKFYLRAPWSRSAISLLWSVTAPYLILMNTTDLRIAMYHNVLLFTLWGIILEAARRHAATVSLPARQRQETGKALYLSPNLRSPLVRRVGIGSDHS